MFAIKYVLSFAIEDSPEDVMIQLDRFVRFDIFLYSRRHALKCYVMRSEAYSIFVMRQYLLQEDFKSN